MGGKGACYIMLSAILYGLMPILCRISYDGGNNGINMAFLKAMVPLPVLFWLLQKNHIPLLPRGRDMKWILLAGGFSAVTTVLLCLSYSYIPVGCATSLHFSYPLAVTLACVFLFGERPDGWKLAALLCGTAGVLFFFDLSGSGLGMGLAVLSGIFYAAFILAVDKTACKRLHPFQFSFYVCLITAALAGIYGVAAGRLTIGLTPAAWAFAALAAIGSSLLAQSLFQLGVRFSGACASAILSLLEPISGVLFGAWILGERMTLRGILGGLLILLGAILVTRSGRRLPIPAPHETQNAP